MNILFFKYTSRINKKGLVPLYCRVSINGGRSQFSTDIFVEAKLWNSVKNRMKGRSIVSTQVNKQLERIADRLFGIHSDMSAVFKGVTAFDVVSNYKNEAVTNQRLVDVFAMYLKYMKELQGKQYSPATIKLFKNTLSHISGFLLHSKYGDVLVDRLKANFADNFIHYLRTIKLLEDSTVSKQVLRLNTVLNFAVRKGIVDFNPCTQVRVKVKPKEIDHLTKEEVEALEQTSMKSDVLNRVKNHFLFLCYTGLSFTDFKNLTNRQLKHRSNGEVWIEGTRQKTGQCFKILLIDKALLTLSKCRVKNLDPNAKVFDAYSNQFTNRYLKKITRNLGLSGSVTSHWGRKSFSTIALNCGVPLESISAVLGHSSTSMTLKSYSRIMDHKIASDLLELNQKLA